ncbi:hypothetical protein LTS08_008602 [Lithohypha guttulata]|nr:hypothetical protein LTS08_008602 [Lithohypha guttulata]
MPSILSIDGGGVRGIAGLVLMKRVQEALDVPWPLWRFFDFVVGTSVGGVIALDLAIGQHSLEQSIARFLGWVSDIFPAPPSGMPVWRHKLRQFWAWVARDSIYDSERLENVMKEAFGKTQHLFSVEGQHWSGIKLGIMATEVSRSELRIFTNYNGIGRCESDSGKPTDMTDWQNVKFRTGYKLLRPPVVDEEPLVFEVARATVAAPPYFRPKQLRGHEPVQDGGLRANNPSEQALWELSAIWPGHARPSLVLSVGTGYHDTPPHKLATQSAWRSRGMPRIVRSFMMSPCLHGQNSWKALLNRLDHSARKSFIRLNLEFEDEEPALDNAAEIPSLRARAESCYIDVVLSQTSIWASAFFFELTGRPQLFCGYYICHGVILCKFEDARQLLRAIRKAYPLHQLAVGTQGLVEFGTAGDYCGECGLFQQRIRLETKTLLTPVDVALHYDTHTRRHLSSFPNSIEWFVARQSASGEFRTWESVMRCACKRTSRKRRVTWTSSSIPKRRRCY